MTALVWTPEMLACLVSMALAGRGDRPVAVRVGVDVAAVRRMRRALGLPGGRRGRPATCRERDARIVTLASSLPSHIIGRRMGMTPVAVRCAIRRFRARTAS